MANLYNRVLSPVIWTVKSDSPMCLSVQIHITSQCDMRCKHCYMYNDDYVVEEMKIVLFTKIVDNIYNYCKEKGMRCYIELTGGDPLLKHDFWKFIEYINRYKDVFIIVIMGNSFHVTVEVAQRMKKEGVQAYQLSLDGLKERHDNNRRDGSFDDVIRALRILKGEGINTNVMFTVSKENAIDFLPLLELLNSMKIVDAIGFDKMVARGMATQRDDYLTPEEYKEFLFAVYKHLVTKNIEISFAFKDNLWKLLFYEMGIVDPFFDESEISTGCAACSGSFAILPSGEIQACRRLGEAVSINDEYKTFIDEIENQRSYLRDRSIYEMCMNCCLWSFCRGCLATRSKVKESGISKDTYCWRK